MKNNIAQVTHFFNLLFYCHIISYQEKKSSYGKFSDSLTLEIQIVWKIPAFQCYKWKSDEK